MPRFYHGTPGVDHYFPALFFQARPPALRPNRLEPLSSAERYDEVEALRQAFKRLEQEFDRLEQSEPPTEGELQAARLLFMRRGEAFEVWADMLEKLHELEGNEEELRTVKDDRARIIQMHGGRQDTRARLERAFLNES